MKKSIVCIMLCFLLATSLAHSEIKYRAEDSYEFQFEIGYSSGSSFFDYNGSTKSQLIYIEDNIEYPYIFTFREYNITPSLNYYLTDNFAVGASFSLSHFSLIEKYKEEESLSRVVKGESSRLFPMYFGLSSKYLLVDKNFKASIFGEMLLPLGFKESETDSSKFFLNKRPFEIIVGPTIQYNFETVWLGAEALYNYRDSEYSPQLISRIKAGLSTVPGTRLMCYFEWVKNLEDFDKDLNFDPRFFQFREEIFRIAFDFLFEFNDELYANFYFHVNGYGHNTHNRGFFKLQMGYLF